jgi:hypothetical protein
MGLDSIVINYNALIWCFKVNEIKWLTQLKDCDICGLSTCQFMYINYVLTQNHFTVIYEILFIKIISYMSLLGPDLTGTRDYIALDTTFGSFTLLKSVSSH